jgi:diadenosine tetraphosphate (Ap4A) HIT family hydrolase
MKGDAGTVFMTPIMEHPVKCPFCKPFADDIVAKNELCYARWDRSPVSKGHLLLMPYRHTPDFFSLTPEEKLALLDLIEVCKEFIVENFSPDSYNIGMNVSAAAGQTILHCPCHMIPRYLGDKKRPKGGIRGVVPEKRGY